MESFSPIGRDLGAAFRFDYKQREPSKEQTSRATLGEGWIGEGHRNGGWILIKKWQGRDSVLPATVRHAGLANLRLQWPRIPSRRHAAATVDEYRCPLEAAAGSGSERRGRGGAAA